MPRLIIGALSALALVLAACSSSPAISGTYRDAMISDKAICNGSGSEVIELTDASGRVIGRDSSPFTWNGSACMLPFSFTNIPSLPGYGIRISGLGGTTYLTPKQVSDPVSLTLTGF